MKGFRFRLARVLRVRRLEEQMARAHFVERQAEARRAEEVAASSAATAREMRTELAERLAPGAIDPRSVLHAHDSLDGMGHVCRRHTERARTADLQAEEARAPWMDVRTGVRALETLEERKKERFRAEAEKRANQELDETAARLTRKKVN